MAVGDILRIGRRGFPEVVIWRQVETFGLTTPPANVNGQVHVVGVGATGAWATHDNEYALAHGGSSWTFETASTNDVAATGTTLHGWTGTDWVLLFNTAEVATGDLQAHIDDATDPHAAAGYAPLASPALTGAPTAPTAAPGTNTTQIATTAFVQAAIAAALEGVIEMEP